MGHDHDHDHDHLAIRRLVADVDKLQSDPDGFTRLLTDDVVLVNLGGRVVRGRDRLYEAMSQALATPLAEVLTKNEIEDVQFLRPDIAVVTCTKHISDNRQDGDGSIPASGVFTLVLVKDESEWRVAMAQTTPLATGQAPRSARPARLSSTQPTHPPRD